MKDKEAFEQDPAHEQAFRLAYLVAGFIRNTLTDTENIELDDWVTANMDNQRLFEQLIDDKNIEEGMRQFNNIDTEKALARIKSKISLATKKRKPRTVSYWMYAAAACIVAVLLSIVFLQHSTPTPKITDMVQTKPADLAPGADRATLTLSDGKIIRLDSIKTGRLAAQGNTNISKLDSGQLAYELIHPSALLQTESYNTLTVPAGGQYKVTLPDGTRVWLNAASSLKYPTVFGGAKRIVELTGEGYFEVAKDPMFPFEVKVDGSTIQVLGTHFNINAYADEPEIKTVLAEGTVKVNNIMILKPGEQATINKKGNLQKGRADIEQALAWKEGRFIFREETIDGVMRQVGRWYNATVVFDADIKDHFSANISRAEPVSKLLHLLEATKAVHFQIDNHQINVMK